MSSIRLSVSGQRALTTTTNAVEATTVTLPTKVDDKASIQVGNATEIRALLPVNARLELVAQKNTEGVVSDTTKYVRLVVPGGGASLRLFVDAPEEGQPGSWPHFNVDLGKHLKDWPDVEVLDVLHERIDELVPPTPEPAEG
jgi:hypothetical protein